MKKKSFKNILKYSVITLLFLSFFLFSSCKKSEEESSINTEDQESQTTEDYFETILSDETETGNEQQAAEESTEEENTSEEETDTSTDEKEEYEPPSCGDTICTYYETYSSCSEDCEKLEEITLYNYPEFLSDVKIVVGDDASSTDVITATVISTYLVTKDIQVETILASEAADFPTSDFILIGSPCVNYAIALLLHYDDETCGDVITEQNNAVIKLLVFESNEVLIITGYDEEDTKYASTMLTDESYNLNGAEEWINLESDGDIAIYFSKN